ncbi:2Fe-2S iron-sulfur cluster-binding protein [Piscinibacter sakaiensis]|uniref:Phenylacetate-CoA oxygenase/reductase, PaaK subunit n=1 Tax=Piscinibacter sakaiensis TaxID=1547922 RepID=A0A0K8NWT7_PISS1|nr:2Fe-2S iron-sulfur cluster-binding protein [Piscinibacter sakaiensis]GAP34744.1 phenylacetate-CoA oxygenase/reductase, PaaK subunit [Piscinibacter sakaiensis]
MSIHFHPLRVTAVQREAEAVVLSVATDALDPAAREAFRFTPGQYLTLRATVDGEDLRRNYSICSAADEPTLRVGIRSVDGGRFSGWAATRLQPGSVLQALPPEGRFLFEPRPGAARHVLCIAAGSGITPMMAILRALLAQEPASRATLIYGNRGLASTMFRDELGRLKDRHLDRLAIHHVFSREAQDTELLHGRLDADRLGRFLERLVPADGVDEAYVCGPAGLLDEAQRALAAAGLPASRVHVERFGDGLPAQARTHAAAAGDAGQARIALVMDGLARELSFGPGDASILDAGLRHGLELPYACKAGVCSTCRGHVLEGAVRMDRNFALTAEEVAAGEVLCCQAHPLTPRVRISLDRR